jgi:hypothetical protein
LRITFKKIDMYLQANGACSIFSNITVETIRVLPEGAKGHLEWQVAGMPRPSISRSFRMAKVLVLYYSTYGHIEKMAQAVAEGARAVSTRRCACSDPVAAKRRAR